MGKRPDIRFDVASVLNRGRRDYQEDAIATDFPLGAEFGYAVLSDGSPEGQRAAFFLIGTFMAIWTILYGAVQAAAPKVLHAKSKSDIQLVHAARHWVGALFFVPAALAVAAALSEGPAGWLTSFVVVGLLIFGALFALNSALHSYLILAFTSTGRVTMDVGFYYMANAAGRLLGTVLSGVTYQIGGLPACLGTAALMIALSWLAMGRLSSTTAAAT